MFPYSSISINLSPCQGIISGRFWSHSSGQGRFWISASIKKYLPFNSKGCRPSVYGSKLFKSPYWKFIWAGTNWIRSNLSDIDLVNINCKEKYILQKCNTKNINNPFIQELISKELHLKDSTFKNIIQPFITKSNIWVNKNRNFWNSVLYKFLSCIQRTQK